MEPTDQQDELAELRANLATAERQRDEAVELLRSCPVSIGHWAGMARNFLATIPGIAGPEQQPETERDNGA